MPSRIEKNFKKWDKGEFVYSEVEEGLMKLAGGERIGRLLRDCTICPVRNGTCGDAIFLTVTGIHPEKGPERKELMICSHGVRDIAYCPLSK